MYRAHKQLIKAIILIGLPGTGKSTCGRILADLLHWKFLDSDEIIESRQKQTVSEIFQSQGEAYFRLLETAFLQELIDTPQLPQLVLSTGGGMPATNGNFEKLQLLGKVVYLQCQPETLADRLKENRQRPLLTSSPKNDAACAHNQLTASLSNLLQHRSSTYNRADLVLESDLQTPESLAKEILSRFALNT